MSVSWPAVLSLLAAISILPLLWWGWGKRDRPGVSFFLLVLVAGVLWSASYGIGLLVFDETYRQLLEIPQWLGMCLVGPAVLGFALEYTGRRELARSYWMAGFAVLFTGAFLLAATNPLHEVMWKAYTLEPVAGAAAVHYETQPLAYAVAGLAFVAVGAGMLLLLEAAVTDRGLYGRQIGIIVLGLLVPGLTGLAWVTELSPLYPLDVTPIGFIATVAATTYSYHREDLFDLAPATRRIADRVAIDDLGMAVLVVNHQDRIVALNAEACDVFGLTDATALGQALTSVTGLEIGITDGEFVLEGPNGSSRTHRVTVSPIDVTASGPVGRIVTVRDVTEEHRRRQRLEVLNRVLRHNLRNDATIIEGNAHLIRDLVDGTDLEEPVEERIGLILETSRELIDASKKARDIARALPEADPRRERVVVDDLLREIVVDSPEATVDVDVPADLAMETDPQLLRIVLENLLENAIEHGGDPVGIQAVATNGTVTITVADSGPGIPEHELEVLRRAAEDDLEHGSGLGLWIAAWGLSALGGQVDFEVGDGTSVTITLPRGA